jgi:hypothetical protein
MIKGNNLFETKFLEISCKSSEENINDTTIVSFIHLNFFELLDCSVKDFVKGIQICDSMKYSL